MVSFEYLYKGLCGLARAHRANAFAGHLGAAVTAGYFFGEDHHNLDGKVHLAIEKELDRIIRGEESLWFDPKKAGVSVPELFEPFPDEDPAKELHGHPVTRESKSLPHQTQRYRNKPPAAAQQAGISTITRALSGNIDKTRQSGHNVIFAAIAIRALHDHPMYATPAILEGICKLIEGFHGAVPGRGYYGKQRGWITGDKVSLPADDGFPRYDSEQAMAEVVIDELIRSASIRRQGFGGLFHIINHAAGLIDLSRFGYRDLARKGFGAHHHHLRLWRSLPDVEEELGKLKRAEHNPRTPQYWSRPSPSQWSAHLTHRIKTLYGFFTLLPLIADSAKRKAAEKEFLFLMA